MRIEPELLIHRKENFLMSSGKVVVVEIKLQKLIGINKPEYPEDYKINWTAFNKEIPQELIRVDNHHEKFLHFHCDNKEEFIEWESLVQTWKLFQQKIIQKFGNFEKT